MVSFGLEGLVDGSVAGTGLVDGWVAGAGVVDGSGAGAEGIDVGEGVEPLVGGVIWAIVGELPMSSVVAEMVLIRPCTKGLDLISWLVIIFESPCNQWFSLD